MLQQWRATSEVWWFPIQSAVTRHLISMHLRQQPCSVHDYSLQNWSILHFFISRNSIEMWSSFYLSERSIINQVSVSFLLSKTKQKPDLKMMIEYYCWVCSNKENKHKLPYSMVFLLLKPMDNPHTHMQHEYTALHVWWGGVMGGGGVRMGPVVTQKSLI